MATDHGFGLIPAWLAGCHFRAHADAIAWQGIIARAGFKLAAFEVDVADTDLPFYVSWYIDDDSRARCPSCGSRHRDERGEMVTDTMTCYDAWHGNAPMYPAAD